MSEICSNPNCPNDDKTLLNEIEELKKELAKYKKPNCKKLSEISEECKKAPQFLDKIPDDAIQIDEYGGRQFDRYYYDHENERILMRTTTGKIKVMKESKFITMSDVNRNPMSSSYKKLIEFLKKAI